MWLGALVHSDGCERPAEEMTDSLWTHKKLCIYANTHLQIIFLNTVKNCSNFTTYTCSELHSSGRYIRLLSFPLCEKRYNEDGIHIIFHAQSSRPHLNADVQLYSNAFGHTHTVINLHSLSVHHRRSNLFHTSSLSKTTVNTQVNKWYDFQSHPTFSTPLSQRDMVAFFTSRKMGSSCLSIYKINCLFSNLKEQFTQKSFGYPYTDQNLHDFPSLLWYMHHKIASQSLKIHTSGI